MKKLIILRFIITSLYMIIALYSRNVYIIRVIIIIIVVVIVIIIIVIIIIIVVIVIIITSHGLGVRAVKAV
jgi:hypothetical protein